MKRLKLYDDILILSINKKEKSKLRKIAYNNKLTMSEFNRLLIKLAIQIDELDKQELDNLKSTKEVNKIMTTLGREI